MKFVLGLHISLLAICTPLIWQRAGAQAGEAFLAGGAVGALSLLSIYLLIQLILRKKSVALATGLVVMKYPILGAILYFAATQVGSIGWLGAGLTTAAVTGLVAGFCFQFQANRKVN